MKPETEAERERALIEAWIAGYGAAARDCQELLRERRWLQRAWRRLRGDRGGMGGEHQAAP